MGVFRGRIRSAERKIRVRRGPPALPWTRTLTLQCSACRLVGGGLGATPVLDAVASQMNGVDLMGRPDLLHAPTLGRSLMRPLPDPSP